MLYEVTYYTTKMGRAGKRYQMKFDNYAVIRSFIKLVGGYAVSIRQM